MYVYPVVSRRAGGVSVGINLNPNNACNWRCIYCQVPELRRGGAPQINLSRLATELDQLLDDILLGDLMCRAVPSFDRKLVDIAFSGNGEPTSAAEFPSAVEIAVEALQRRGLLSAIKLRLITNGSLINRRSTRAGLTAIDAAGGEVWFKVDTVDRKKALATNGIRLSVEAMERNLTVCYRHCATWVQTCLFSLDGQLPSLAELDKLANFLAPHREHIQGVFLYGLARRSAQEEAARLTRVPATWLEAAAVLMRELGLTVKVSP